MELIDISCPETKNYKICKVYQSSSLNNFKVLVNYRAFLQSQDAAAFYKPIEESKLLFFSYRNIPLGDNSSSVPLTSLVFDKEATLSSSSIFNDVVEPFNINLD